jgi:hypothetical protein
MEAVVALLLARMETNPEEFKDLQQGKWSDILADLLYIGTDSQLKKIRAKLRAIQKKENVQPLETLLLLMEYRNGGFK